MGDQLGNQNPDSTVTTARVSTEDINKKEDDLEKSTHVEINTGEDDDVKDPEKALLEENERNQEIAISINEGDAPPLPSKKGKPESRHDAPEPPSMFVSPFERMKYDWEHSLNLVEFFTRATFVIFTSVGWITLVGGIPFIAIVQLIVGAVYLEDCKANPKIPRYQVAAGFFGIVLHCLTLFTKYVPKGTEEAAKVHRRRCMCIETLVQIFLFIFFTAGCTWVYSIYEPDYVNTDHDDYCHKGLYLFSFWLFNLTFIVLCSIIALGICGVACVAINNSPSEQIVMRK